MLADDERVKVIYDQWGPEYDSYIIEEEKFRKEAAYFADIFSTHGAESVHDCGCGTGRHATYLAERGFDVQASDLSEGMLHQAQNRAEEKGLDIRFFRAAFQQLADRADRTYDGVLCAGLGIAHLTEEHELRRGLENIFALLNPGGVAVFENPPVHALVSPDEPMDLGPLRVERGEEGDLLNFRFLYHNGDHTLTYGVLVLRQSEDGEWDYEVRSFPLWAGITAQLQRMLPEVGFRDVQVRESLTFLPEYGETEVTVAVK